MQNFNKIPVASAGMKIGLFGGSFNPPHQGHVHVSKTAIRKLGLDQLWWIVSPGNPLKNHDDLLPLAERLARCRRLTRHPDIRITAFEADFRLRYTADTVELLRQRRPQAQFVWVMGADNFSSFHRWDRWKIIANNVPLAVIDRPDSTTSPNSSSATHALARYRVDERDSRLLAHIKPPAWTFIHSRRSYLSSTQIRNRPQTNHT
jgi:nicotinate-nucleotide adenylyltransferase